MTWNWLPVSAKRLRGRTVQHGQRRVSGVSFLPFFERTGEVQRLLYVVADSAEIYSIPADATFPRVPYFGRIRLPQGVAFLTPIRKAGLAEFTKLWHYDPWWGLDEGRFAGHWARQSLKQTNCVARTKSKLATVYYRRDLSRLQWMARPDGSGTLAMTAWDESQLPARPALARPRARRTIATTWVLDPIWNRR
jgi:hypothetical protein